MQKQRKFNLFIFHSFFCFLFPSSLCQVSFFLNNRWNKAFSTVTFTPPSPYFKVMDIFFPSATPPFLIKLFENNTSSSTLSLSLKHATQVHSIKVVVEDYGDKKNSCNTVVMQKMLNKENRNMQVVLETQPTCLISIHCKSDAISSFSPKNISVSDELIEKVSFNFDNRHFNASPQNATLKFIHQFIKNFLINSFSPNPTFIVDC